MSSRQVPGGWSLVRPTRLRKSAVVFGPSIASAVRCRQHRSSQHQADSASSCRVTMLQPRISPREITITSLATALNNLAFCSRHAPSTRSPQFIFTRHASHAAQGRANGPKDSAGRRLGAKKSASEYVIPGNIIFKQRGTIVLPPYHSHSAKSQLRNKMVPRRERRHRQRPHHLLPHPRLRTLLPKPFSPP